MPNNIDELTQEQENFLRIIRACNKSKPIPANVSSMFMNQDAASVMMKNGCSLDYYNAAAFSWSLFDELRQFDCEKQNDSYFYSAIVAASLLRPKFMKMNWQRGRIVEGNTSDYMEEIIFRIRVEIPRYDEAKSKFPIFIEKSLQNTAYCYDRDSTPYHENKKNIQIHSSEIKTDIDGEDTVDLIERVNADNPLDLQTMFEEREKAKTTKIFTSFINIGRQNKIDVGHIINIEDVQSVYCGTAVWKKMLGGIKNFPKEYDVEQAIDRMNNELKSGNIREGDAENGEK